MVDRKLHDHHIGPVVALALEQLEPDIPCFPELECGGRRDDILIPGVDGKYLCHHRSWSDRPYCTQCISLAWGKRAILLEGVWSERERLRAVVRNLELFYSFHCPVGSVAGIALE